MTNAENLLQTSKERDRAVIERQETIIKLKDCERANKVLGDEFDMLKADLKLAQDRILGQETQLLVLREKLDRQMLLRKLARMVVVTAITRPETIEQRSSPAEAQFDAALSALDDHLTSIGS